MKILHKNYFTKFGEIDLIGFEKETILFVEVKLRTSTSFGLPYEAVTESKLKKIQKAAECYMLSCGGDFDYRLDVISILYNTEYKKCEVEWIKNQFFY